MGYSNILWIYSLSKLDRAIVMLPFDLPVGVRLIVVRIGLWLMDYGGLK